MQKDSRQGVRKVARALQKRQEREQRERHRVRSMLNYERPLWGSGIQYVAGVDEVGIGALAGPVVAAATIFRPEVFIPGVNDSKALTPRMRDRLAKLVRRQALATAIGVAEVREINQVNVYRAGLLAMKRAVQKLSHQPEQLLVDAREIPGILIPQTSLKKGDSISFSIAAASILAKTHRDKIMAQLGLLYPEYGFAQHKGYATPKHQSAIQCHGACRAHRSFDFINELCGRYSGLFYKLRSEVATLGSAKAMRQFKKKLGHIQSQLRPSEDKKIRLLLRRHLKSTAGGF